MITPFWSRRALSGAAVALASLLAACSSPPPAVTRAPPPPVTLAPQVIEQASAYRVYMQRATQIDPAFQNGAAVADSLRTAAAYEPRQLMRGAMAYGAVAALQEPRYVASVRAFAIDPAARRQMVAQILREPSYVLGLEGAQAAAGLAVAAIGEEGQKLYQRGTAVKQAAYDIQRSPWSKSEVANRPGRLAQTKALSGVPQTGDSQDVALLSQAAVGAAPLALTPSPAQPPYSPVVVRSLALAALAALGSAGDANISEVTNLLSDPASDSCLSMSKLNLYQCLAVSKPHYEDVFCLGQHVLMDTGQCLIRSAGLPAPVAPARVKVAETTAAAGTKGASARPASKKR